MRHAKPPFRLWLSIVKTRKPNMCSPRQAFGRATSGPPQHTRAARSSSTGISLSGHFYLGITLSLDGRHEEALEAIETGWHLSPRDSRASTWLANKARVFYHLKRYEEAIETALSARRIRPHAYGSLVLIASYAQLGRDEEAKNALADMSSPPGGSENTTRWYLDRYSDPVAREHMADGLRMAGLLEQ